MHLAQGDVKQMASMESLQQKRTQKHKVKNERGVVMIWFALMLLMILGMAGLAVDISNWWLQADRLQRAADAAAHGGVTFLPGDLTTARSVARSVAGDNEFPHGGDTSVAVNQESNPNQLRVSITTKVDTFFVRIFGKNDVTLTRDAVAEYVAPLPMGSPQNKLGSDPDGVDPGTQLWLIAAGPETGKQQGERYGSKKCDWSQKWEFACSGGRSTEYVEDGYFFVVDVKNPVPGQDLIIQAFDPVFFSYGAYCDRNTWQNFTSSQLSGLWSRYGSDRNRYTSTSSSYCTGDNTWGAGNVQTTFIPRAPSNVTPWTDADNPVINNASCRPRQADSYTMPYSNANNSSRRAANTQYVYDLLVNNYVERDRTPNTPRITFSEGFRNWATLCRIPANQVQKGQYIIQVRTNATMGNPLVYNPNVTTEGSNSYALRAGFGNGGLDEVSGSNVEIFARGKLPIYANSHGANTNFYLARILPHDAGRTLRISMYDMGESSQTGVLTVLPPQEYATRFTGCSITRDDGAYMSVSANQCRLSNVISSSANNYSYNGRLITFDVPIPLDYTCNVDDSMGCWIKINSNYNGNDPVHDATTWTAAILGNPIRIVE